MGKLIEQYAGELRGQSEKKVTKPKKVKVADPLERYNEAKEKKERFEVTFGYAAQDGTLYGQDEYGIKLVLDGEQLSKDLSYYSADLKANFIGTPFVVRVRDVDDEEGVVYLRSAWSDGKDTVNRIIAEIRAELAREDRKEPLIIPGRILSVSEKSATVDLLGKGIIGIISVDNWQKGYVRYFKDVVHKNDVYDFVVRKELPRKDKSRPTAFSLTRKPITEDPWEHIPENLEVGSVITVKCLGRPEGKTFWWGTSPMIEGIELMGDYSGSVPRPLVGTSYKCKITKLDPKKHRLQVVPFALASKDTGTKEAVEFITSKKTYK